MPIEEYELSTDLAHSFAVSITHSVRAYIEAHKTEYDEWRRAEGNNDRNQ